MEKQLVSFEIAKLLKEVGFNHITSNCFDDVMAYELDTGKLICSHRANTQIGYVLAPSLCYILNWLINEYNIYCKITPNDNKVDITWNYGLYYIKMPTDIVWLKGGYETYKTYNEALKKVLYEALMLIKNKQSC